MSLPAFSTGILYLTELSKVAEENQNLDRTSGLYHLLFLTPTCC